MKLQWMGKAALAVCFWAMAVHSGHAQQYQEASYAAELAGASLASYDTFDSSCNCNTCATDGNCGGGGCYDGNCGGGSCSSGGGSGFDLGTSLLDRPGQFFGYAEYIYARASFSEAISYVVQNPDDLQGGQVFNQFDFGYNSSYRFGGGYRFYDCGGAIVFNFARYRSNADFGVQGIDTATTNSTPEILTPYEVDAIDGTQFVNGSADVDLKSYDIGFAKTIPLGSPLGCGDCGDCVDCNDGCGWCPAWDLTWSAGLRFAQADWSRSTAAYQTGSTTVPIDSATTRMNFEGAGARWGLLGRRYIGRQGRLSIYAKGDLSLLVGRVQLRTDFTNPQAGTLRVHETSARNMIPVTEIEAGMTAHLGNRLQLSGGYFLSAWHDLGMRDTYDFSGQLASYDDANILGFDGFFARAEFAF